MKYLFTNADPMLKAANQASQELQSFHCVFRGKCLLISLSTPYKSIKFSQFDDPKKSRKQKTIPE